MVDSTKYGICATTSTVAQVGLLCIIIFSNPAATMRKSNCSAVKLKGPYNRAQHMLIGVVFEQISVDENGKPVFAFNKVDGTKEYLHCYKEASRSYWGVGPSYKENSFGLQQYEYGTHCTDHPVDDRRTWEIYDGSDMIPYPDATVVCAQAPKRGSKTCDTVEIVGANIPVQDSLFGVPFKRNPNNLYEGHVRDKPLFMNDKGYYIYQTILHENYFEWGVGPIGLDKVEMFSGSSVGHPAEITGTWYIAYGNSFHPHPNVSVNCIKGPGAIIENEAGLPADGKQAKESDKSSSNTALVIGVAVAVVVVIVVLFSVFFLLMWKQLKKINRQAGHPTVVYTPTSVKKGSPADTSTPVPSAPIYNYVNPVEENLTGLGNDGYVTPSL